MATTRIMPLHTGKDRTESQAVSDIIDYVSNPQKTDNGRLVTGFACDSRVADAEFLLSKREYISTTGRVRGADDVLAYHVRQSFVPGEITPEEANRLGVEFAKRFTKGNHAFVVCTHIDKSHIHNHIIWNAVNVNCDRKFRNFWGSTRAVRRLNDTICVENGYSIVEDPKPHGKSYNKWLGDRAKPSHREQLRVMIDQALEQKPADFGWLVMALILFIRKITVYQDFVKYIRASCVEVADIDLLERFGKLVERKQINTTVELYTNNLISSPLLIGFFRPYIILPTVDLSPTDFDYTILHELVHFKRRDMFYKWLVQFTLCIHWFNPFVYLMSREIGKVCELSCDEAVMLA